MIVGKKQGDALLLATEPHVLFWVSTDGVIEPGTFAARVASYWPRGNGPVWWLDACVPGALLAPSDRVFNRYFHAAAIYSTSTPSQWVEWTASAITKLQIYAGKTERCAFVRFPAGAPTRELIQILHQSRVHFVAYT